MDIPTELKPLIAQVRQQHPHLKDAPDEVVGKLLVQAPEAWLRSDMPENPGEVDVEKFSAEECIAYGERLLNVGRWQAAERFFLAGPGVE